MIILKKIQLNNFLSHAKTTINFKPEQKLLIDGKSGAGKSAIVESILFALYGKGRSSNNRSLIKHGCSKAEISVELKDNDSQYSYLIERSITNKNKQTFKVQEKTKGKEYVPVKTKGIKETQAYLEKKILHSSYILFINSIIYLQENTENFVKQTASTRKNIILEIIKTTDYDEYLQKTKNELQKIITDQEVIRAKIEDKKNNINSNKENADKLNEYKKKEKDSKNKIKEIKAHFNQSDNRLKEIQKTLSEINVQYAQMEAKLKEHDEHSKKLKELNQIIINLSDIKTEDIVNEINVLNEKKKQLDEHNTVKDQIAKWNAKQAELLQNRPVEHNYEAEIKDINQQLIELLGEDVGKCPKCGYISPERTKKHEDRVNIKKEQLKAVQANFEAYKRDLATYEQKIKELGPQPQLPLTDDQYKQINQSLEKLNELNKKLIEAENAKKKIAETSEEIKTIKAKQKTLSEEVKELENKVTKKDNFQTEESELKKDIALLNSKIEEEMAIYTSNNQLLGIAQHATQKIKQSKEELDKLNDKRKANEVSLEALYILKEALGPNGIRAIVIDYVIPELEDKINNILSKLSDFRVKLETQKSGIGKDITLEGLFITIVNEIGEESDFDNFSGGEKLKIIVAISEALTEIQKVGFRILDELFIGLDEESTESFVNVMTTLQDSFPQLFCISHLQSIKDMFDEELLITKTHGNSQII